MRKIIYLVFIVSIVVLTILLFKTQFVKRENKTYQNSKQTYQTQTNSEREVTVEVIPVNLSAKENVKFNVVLNTHSFPLDKDLKDISVLLDDQNNEFKPISWSGGIGGHHLEGILTFPKLSKEPKSVKLVIKGIADTDREFLFPL